VIRKLIFLVILTFYSFFLWSANLPISGKVSCVVIDAGHGGKDPGAIGFLKTKEKDVALSLALKLGQLINTYYPDVKVVYTRSTDVFVELFQRAKIANDNKADLFISIHCNATIKADSYGVETFVMGLHKSAANLEVAKNENATILLEDNYIKQYDGFNPNSAEAYITFSLFQNIYLNQSLQFATTIQNNFKSHLKLFDRGVKQAGFLVLYKTSMPSVLIETGFISNPRDEQYLISEKGQQSIAKSLLNGFGQYKAQIESIQNNVINIPEIGTDILLYTEVIDPRDTMKSIQNPETLIDSLKVKNKPKLDNTKPNNHNNSSNSNLTNDSKKNISEIGNELFFSVQFYSSSTKTLKKPEYKNIENIKYYKQEHSYKFISGKFLKIDEANNYLKKLKKMGFNDAFVVALNKGKRISTSKATALLKNNKH